MSTRGLLTRPVEHADNLQGLRPTVSNADLVRFIRLLGGATRTLPLPKLLGGGELSNRQAEGAAYCEHESKTPRVL